MAYPVCRSWKAEDRLDEAPVGCDACKQHVFQLASTPGPWTAVLYPWLGACVVASATYHCYHRAFVDGEFEDELASVFDKPEAEPSELFVNPFACSVSPMFWREVQEAAQGGNDPVSALAARVVYVSESAVCYLTPGQLAVITADLEAMPHIHSEVVGLTRRLVWDYLTLAVRANENMPAQR